MGGPSLSVSTGRISNGLGRRDDDVYIAGSDFRNEMDSGLVRQSQARLLEGDGLDCRRVAPRGRLLLTVQPIEPD